MAEVYLGQQRLLNRRVAVKVLKPELADDPAYLKRFEREAQAAAALVHANIVQIYEVGHSDGLHYIVQEYVGGLNLHQWLARHGPAQLGRALSIMRQTAAALAKAADEGVVHRDIKPENIMLTDAGEVKVADFGLARLTRDDESLDLTQAGMTMGTPLYMSPEQVEGKPLDSRSDIYSLGATCYQMLSGSPPFVGETALGVAVQHLKKEPQPLESLRPDLPPALCRVVHKMLAKDLANRWQSPQELLRELRRMQQEYCPEGAADLGEWEAAASPSTDPRLEVTRQLAAVMKAGGGKKPAAAVACGRVPGGGLGRRGRDRPAGHAAGTAAGRLRQRTRADSPPVHGLAAVFLRQPNRRRRGLAERDRVFSRKEIGRPPRSSNSPASLSASATTPRRWPFSTSSPRIPTRTRSCAPSAWRERSGC